jgi:hypothetical protein
MAQSERYKHPWLHPVAAVCDVACYVASHNKFTHNQLKPSSDAGFI